MEYAVTSLLLTAINYGGYISPVKFVIFLLAFFAQLPVFGWVQADARKVGTNDSFWAAVVFGASAAALLLWLLLPFFLLGLLIYLLAAGAATIAYVMHRNDLVSDFEKVLTADHIRGIFTSGKKKFEELEDFVFITANNNEVPVPEPNTPELLGFKAAYDTLSDAIKRRVSDIVFSPTQDNYTVTYYIDGAAIKQPPRPRDRMEYLIYFLKSLAALDTKEKRKPQKGRFVIQKGKDNIEFSVSSAGSTAGEQIQLKQLTQQQIERLDELGLPPEQFEQISRLRNVTKGLFLVSAPGKNGATTTFYALLRNHDPYLYSIATIERQITAKLVNVAQNVFTLSDTGTSSYAKKLQSIVLTEPNIIGVSDCQDAETAKIACNAAKDGRLVYVTIKANNVIEALGKWIKLTGDKNLAVGTLLGITNQRLLRKLCQKCKQPYEPNKELLRKFNIPPDRAKVLYRAGEVQYTKRGKAVTCENCQGTGFVGRMCIFETIMLNAELRKSIMQAKSLGEVATEFRRARMLYLQEQALKKIIEGTTTINEMVRVLSSGKQNKKQKKT